MARQSKLGFIDKWLIPNNRNSFHPKLLQPWGLLAITVLITAMPFFYNSVLSSKPTFVLGYATDIDSSSLFSLTNQQRAQAGQASLSLNSLLSQAAENKANDMFAKNYWAHNSPTGQTPWDFISASGYSYSAAGENLAKDFSTSNGVVTAWMNSPEHRANILNSSFRDVGFAVENGNLLGEPTTLVVAMYGTPSASTTPKTPAPKNVAAIKPTPTAPPAQQSVATATPAAPAPTPAPPAATQQPAKKGTGSVKSQSATTSTNPPQQEVLGTSVISQFGDYASNVFGIATLQTLNWGQKVTVFILSTLILINIFRHTLVWRQQKKGRRHIWLRSHPLAQISILMLAIIITLVSSYGVIL